MTSYSGLWNNEYGQNYSLLSNRIGNTHTALARVFANRLYGRATVRGVLASLINGAVGDAAYEAHKRVTAERDLHSNVQGGVRAIETFVAIDRNTSVDDQTDALDALDLSPQPTYPVDRSGNGGGNKLGW